MDTGTNADETGGTGALSVISGDDTGCFSLQGGGLAAGGGVHAVCSSGEASGTEMHKHPVRGVLVGSGCGCDATEGTGITAWILVLFVLRRFGPALALALVPLVAHAVDVDQLDPDGGTWTALREGDLGGPGEAQVSLAAGMLRSPAVISNGKTSSDVLAVVTTGDLAGSVNFGRLQLSGFLPVYPVVIEDATVFPLETTDPVILTLWGDVGLGVGVALTPEERSKWSAQVRTSLGTGAAGHLLGDAASRLTLANDTPLGRRFHLGGDLGIALRTPINLPGSVWGNSAEYGAGLAWRPSDWEQLATEGFGAIGLTGPTAASVPFEVLASSRSALDPTLDVRIAGGTGVGVGLGNPRYRVLLELDVHGPIDRDQDGDHRPDIVDLCPRKPEDDDHFHQFDACPDPDNDRDTLLDDVDHCPDDPEVWNGWSDTDGCPDDLARVAVTLGAGVESATVSVDGSPLGRLIAGESYTVERAPGELLFTAESDGFEPLYVVEQAEEGDSQLELELVPLPSGGVDVTVEGPDGAPVDARVLAGTVEVEAPGGRARILHSPGPVDVEATAVGFEPGLAHAVVPQEGDAEVAIRLERVPVVERAHVLLGDEIRFALDEARIAGSEAALDDYADWMSAHPEVRLLRIEGHADAVGTSAYNLDLSVRRAEAVRAALVARGIAESRLQVLGSGEAWRSPEAASQRLVDFLVLVWDERAVAEMPVAP